MAKFPEKLSSLHCDVGVLTSNDVSWMWKVEELSSFLEWFVQHIDDSNCVNKRYISLFFDWSQEGKELQGTQLDQALEGYGVDVHTHLHSDLSESDLELWDQELDELRAQLACAENIESLLIEENERACTTEHSVEGSLRAAQIACQKEGQILMKVNASLKATISTFFNNFSKLITAFKDSEDPDIQYNCISKMSLASPIHMCERFDEYANLCLKRKFESPSISDKPLSELMSFLEDDSLRSASISSSVTGSLPNKMWKAEVNRIALQGTLMGLSAASHHLQTLKKNVSFEKFSSLQLKLEATTLKDEISRLSENIALLLRHETGNVVVDVILCCIINVVEKISRTRIERRQIMVKELCQVNNVIHDFLTLTDLLWMLLTDESQKFKVGVDLIKEISSFYTEEINRHEATMCGLKIISTDYNRGAESLKCGQAHLLNIVQRLLNALPSETDSGNGTLLDSQQWDEEFVQNCFDFSEYIHSEKSILELLLELSSGPTKKPNLVRKELVQEIQKIQSQIDKSQSELDGLLSSFSAKQLLFRKSPLARNRRLLWAWFLVAPEKLEQAVHLALEERQRKM